MLLLESQIRSIIRQELKLVLEDKKSFLAAVTPDNILTHKQRITKSPKDINTSGRNIKKLWAAHADHQFMSKVNTIHWWGNPSAPNDDSPFVLGQMSGYAGAVKDFFNNVLTKISRRDELSTMGYLPQDDFKMTGGFAKGFGVQIKGRVTLAAKQMDSLLTGYYRQGAEYTDMGRSREEEDIVAQQKASSGFVRRPQVITKSALKNYILDEKSFDYDTTEETPGNEFVVDNWKPIAIVVFNEFLPALKDQYSKIVNIMTKDENLGNWMANNWTDEDGTVSLLKYMLSTGLPIFDLDKNQITEEQLKPYMTRPTPLTMSTNKSKEELAADELWEMIQNKKANSSYEVDTGFGYSIFQGEYGEEFDDFIYINRVKDLKAALKLLVSQGKLIETNDKWGQIVYKIAE